MIRKAGAVTAFTLLTGAAPAPQTAPTTTALAECRLTYAQAQKVVASLVPTGSTDESTAGEQNVTEAYPHDGVTAFGFTATMFTLNEFDNNRIHQHMYGTELGAPFAVVRAALLKAHGKTSCDIADTVSGTTATCMIHLRNDDSDKEHDVDLLLAERNGVVRSGCVYSTPGALH